MKLIRKSLSTYIPLAARLKNYSPRQFRGDLIAGTTVGVMLIPQGMAYAVLAGMPPVYGLYAAIFPLIIYAFLGTSRHLAVGPTAILSLLVIAGISQFATPGSDRFIQLAIFTAFGAGVMQLMMGMFRMGILVNFLSSPVLSGFTSAASVIIIISQLRNILGIDLNDIGNFHEILVGTLQHLDTFNPETTLVGLASIIFILACRRFNKLFPSALCVVFIGTLIAWFLRLDLSGVHIVGSIPAGLPGFSAAFISSSDIGILLPLMFVIALVSYMESIAVGKTLAHKHGYKIHPNQELIAMGASKIIGSLFQAYPTTGSFSRSAVNSQTNCQSGVASLVSAAIIALTLLFLTPLFTFLPSAVLAAIIIVAVLSLFDYGMMIELWHTDRKDFIMLIITFLATLLFGIVQGIAVGVILSLATVIYSSTRPHTAILGRLDGTKTFRNLNRYPKAKTDPDILIFRFDSPLYFASTEYFQDSIEELVKPKGDDLRLVVLDASAISGIDSTGIQTMRRIIRDLEKRHIRFYIASAIGPVRDKLKKSGITDQMGAEKFFFDVWDAIAFYKGELTDERWSGPSPLQSNF